MFRARLIGLRNGALLLEHGGAGSARALSEVVPSENDVASTSGSKLLPPVGRELLAAVKLGLPGAKEEFDKQQRLFEKRFGARRMGRMYNETGNFRGMWKKETQFAAKDTVSPPLSLSLSPSRLLLLLLILPIHSWATTRYWVWRGKRDPRAPWTSSRRSGGRPSASTRTRSPPVRPQVATSSSGFSSKLTPC